MPRIRRKRIQLNDKYSLQAARSRGIGLFGYTVYRGEQRMFSSTCLARKIAQVEQHARDEIRKRYGDNGAIEIVNIDKATHKPVFETPVLEKPGADGRLLSDYRRKQQ